MKNVFIISLTLIYLTINDIYAQSWKFIDQVFYTSDSTFTKDVIFQKSHEWFALNFKSANDVIQLKDQESGKLIGKGVIKVEIRDAKMYPFKGYYRFTIQIECKTGRYKCSIYDVEHFGGDSGYNDGGDIRNEQPLCTTTRMWKSDWEKIKGEAMPTFQSVFAGLNKYIETDSKNEDW